MKRINQLPTRAEILETSYSDPARVPFNGGTAYGASNRYFYLKDGRFVIECVKRWVDQVWEWGSVAEYLKQRNRIVEPDIEGNGHEHITGHKGAMGEVIRQRLIKG